MSGVEFALRLTPSTALKNLRLAMVKETRLENLVDNITINRRYLCHLGYPDHYGFNCLEQIATNDLNEGLGSIFRDIEIGDITAAYVLDTKRDQLVAAVGHLTDSQDRHRSIKRYIRDYWTGVVRTCAKSDWRDECPSTILCDYERSWD